MMNKLQTWMKRMKVRRSLIKRHNRDNRIIKRSIRQAIMTSNLIHPHLEADICMKLKFELEIEQPSFENKELLNG